MPGPLVETKLHIPSHRRTLVERARLAERLARGNATAVTLVSAPAGFGKTTVVAEWVRAQATVGAVVVWLSVDEHDDDPARFWRYVFAAVDRALPEVTSGARSLLDADAPVDTALAALINALHALDRDVVIVLDDLHEITTVAIHDALASFVDHLPPRVHLVVTSRADPPLPLARWRARGELTEIRGADLRFTAGEAADYLNGAMGLELGPDAVATLEARTEGWIAALQLAALSMQGRDDVTGFIAGFAGDDRFIVDYLVGEVLHRQPASVRHFLLDTSVLEQLSGSLCDAVTGTTGGTRTLAALDRDNLFVIPLDDRREWYRYHQLFADVLRARLVHEAPATVATLHRRASDWFAERGRETDAIRHALAAGEVDRAAALAELALPAVRRDRRDATLREWARELPEDVVAGRPVLAVGLVGPRISAGDLDGVERVLGAAEEWLARTPEERLATGTVVDDAQLRALPAAIEMYRAAVALTRGRPDATVTHAGRALAAAPADDELGRAAAHTLLGLAAWTAGDLDPAFAAYTEGIAGMRRAGHVADVLGLSIAMADIRVAQGRLRDAERLYEQGLQLVADHGAGPLRGVADMHIGLAEIRRERGDQAGAAEALERGEALAAFGTPQFRYRALAVRAGLCLADGDLPGCLALLDEAEQAYDTDFSPAVRPPGARRARTDVLAGDIAAARRWAVARGLSTGDEVRYVTEFEHITLAIIELADDPDARAQAAVVDLLDRLLVAAEAGDRGGSVIEILAVQALAYDACGDADRAAAALDRALTLAEPEGYSRVFSFLGPRLQSLRAARAGGPSPPPSPPTRSAADRPAGLVDPLSDRELDVLRYLRSDLSGPDIARELHVSLNTLRTHTKSIYSKLGVNSRRAAVTRAAELGL